MTHANDAILNSWFDGTSTVFTAGAPIDTPAKFYQRDDGVDCVDASATLDPADTFYTAVPAGENNFAHANFESVAGAENLLRRPRIVTDEGLIVEDFFFGLAFDVVNDLPCGFYGSPGQCDFLDVNFLQDVFTDASTCLNSAIAGAPQANAFIQAGYNADFYNVSRSEQNVESYGNGTCASLGPQDIYTLGAKLTIQAGTPYLVGSDRVQQSRFSADGLSWMFSHWDSQTNAFCTDVLTADGVFRCVPNASINIKGFLDDQCTEPVALLSGGGFGTDPIVAIQVDVCTSGYPVYRLYTVTGSSLPVTQPHVLQADGSCGLDPDPFWQLDYVNTFGAEIDPATYPPILDD